MKPLLLNQYDFVVFGTHPAALWGAILLLERGLKVLVLPLLSEPSLDSDQSGLVRKIELYDSHRFVPNFLIEQNGIHFSSSQVQEFQILTPERRFRFYQQAELFQQEWDFVFGKNAANPLMIEKKILNKTTYAIQRGLGFLVRGYESIPLLPEDFKFILSMRNAFFEIKENTPTLCEHLLAKIQGLGGHLDLRTCQNIFVDKKSLVGVQLVGDSTMISTTHAIIGTSQNQVQKFLSEKQLLKSEPVGWKFEIKIEVSPEAVPLGVTSKMVFVEGDSTIVEMIQGRQGGFTLKTLMPMTEISLNREYQRKIAQRLLKLFSHYIPDLEYNLRSVYPDIRDPERAENVDLKIRYPFTHLDSIPNALLSFAIPGLGHQSVIQGVYYANEEAYPIKGHWGAYQGMWLSLQDWAKKNQRTDFASIPSPIST